MLNQILREMESAQGTVRLDELAARLNMETGALEGMIAFWVQKGRMQLADDGQAAAICGDACGDGCPAASACPLVGKIPKMYSVSRKNPEYQG